MGNFIRRLSSSQIIILGFAAAILLGCLLLMLPFATVDGQGAPFSDALFTATSAVCVTGLVVHDTATYWSLFGKLVLITLIQIGGMGVITIAVALYSISGKRVSLKQRSTMVESISGQRLEGIVGLTGFIVKMTLVFELLGALLLSPVFIRRFGPVRGICYSLFHSISAFCNAGFDLMGESGPFSSLTGYAADPLVIATAALLIIVGGVGFLTWSDICEHRTRFKEYRLQSKLVFVTTLALLLGGFLYFALYEFRLPQWQAMSPGEKLQAAAFQAVTPRTAGFNTVDLSRLSAPSQLLTILLMLVGGSPGSTAGGFKTTTLAVLLLSVGAVFRRRDSAQCFGRRLPDDSLRSASAIFMLYLMLFLSGGMLICCIDGISLMDAMFESASAIATVGLSVTGTAGLSALSRAILIFLMYFGRVGGLTMIYAVNTNGNGSMSQYPQERVTVG